MAVLLIALATTGGAVMSAFRLPIQRYATERIMAAREVHNLSGSRDYDIEVVNEIVFTVEAGLSFFHTHGEGMGATEVWINPPKPRATEEALRHYTRQPTVSFSLTGSGWPAFQRFERFLSG